MAKIGITNVMECTSDPSSSSILELHELIFRDGIDFSRDPFPEMGPLGVRKHFTFLEDLQTPPKIKINIMTFLLSSCVLWISTCISFLSADSIISVSARLNSTVLLPCNFTCDPSKTPHVRWYIGSEMVFERLGERAHQGKAYEGRLDVPGDELLKGNCSLVLENVRVSDAKTYKSFMMVKDKGSEKWDVVQKVELIIDETPMPDKEQHKENSSRTNDAGINSPYTPIIISSAFFVFFILLAIMAVIRFRAVLYRWRNINKHSNQIALSRNLDVEHRVFVDT